MERWRGRVALVTGASVGIGAAIAVELVRCGMKVMGCARDVGKIQVCAEVKLQIRE
uniref:Dehydrogenase/reductase (SDR family) member 11b n=1 Tax=Amphilophus citrinellus TaxID=61819 RepID=A0A3Q0RMY8_AMPCI